MRKLIFAALLATAAMSAPAFADQVTGDCLSVQDIATYALTKGLDLGTEVDVLTGEQATKFMERLNAEYGTTYTSTNIEVHHFSIPGNEYVVSFKTDTKCVDGYGQLESADYAKFAG